MSNFLVVLPTSHYTREAQQIFQNGLSLFQTLRNENPTRLLELNWAWAASFPRKNGSGSPIVMDPKTGNWLLASGVWFHKDDYGVGDELKLLHRFCEVEPACVGKELEGFFVIVVGNQQKQELHVVTDIVGSCHVFMRSWPGVTAFSSSSLILAGLDQIMLDPIGCQEFLSTGVIYEDRTFYQEVKKLGPARVIRFDKGGLISQEQYWGMNSFEPESLGGTQAVELFAHHLTNAVKKIGKVFERPVCDLTGGYDSRAVVAAFLKSGMKFSTTVSGADDSPDVMVSKKISNVFGLSHLHIPRRESMSLEHIKTALCYTDGEYDLLEYSQVLQVHQQLMNTFDISINGSFGEVARGYWWELLFPGAGNNEPLDTRKIAQKRYVAQPVDQSLFPGESRLDLVSHFAEIIERTNAHIANSPNTLQMDNAYLMMRMQRWQGRIASSTNQLWPCLSPCLFRSVLETMLTTKTKLRRRGLLLRWMLSRLQLNLAMIPLEHGWPSIPATWKTIYRFWPVPVYLGKKVFAKLTAAYGSHNQTATASSHVGPPRLQLWKEEEISELLSPSTMKVRELIDCSVLKDFLNRSKNQNFTFDQQWARLFSLEYSQQALAKVKFTYVA